MDHQQPRATAASSEASRRPTALLPTEPQDKRIDDNNSHGDRVATATYTSGADGRHLTRTQPRLSDMHIPRRQQSPPQHSSASRPTTPRGKPSRPQALGHSRVVPQQREGSRMRLPRRYPASPESQVNSDRTQNLRGSPARKRFLILCLQMVAGILVLLMVLACASWQLSGQMVLLPSSAGSSLLASSSSPKTKESSPTKGRRKRSKVQTSNDEKRSQTSNKQANPFSSTPPKPVPLLQTSDPAILVRHHCIQAIRERHQQILGPLLPSNDGTATILLVDPAYHENVGDHMITLGELEFLRQRLVYEESQIHQCSYVQAGVHVPPCATEISKWSNVSSFTDSSAVWHGGGNWGDIWKQVQPKRIQSFSLLLQHNHTVVGMPQSLYYRDKVSAESDAKDLKHNISVGLSYENDSFLDTDQGRLTSRNRVYLAWREYESLERAKELYPFVANLLVPDIAFQLGPYELRPPPSGSVLDLDLVLLLRGDHESTLSQYREKSAVRKVLQTIPGGERLNFRIVDWVDRLELFDSSDPFFTDTSIQLLSMGRVVICDRLHAAILCYLVGVPFVYIDQISGKISKSLRVAFDSWNGCKDGSVAMWAGATSFPSSLEIAVQFLRKYNLRVKRSP